MSGLRFSRNLLAPPTVIRAGNPGCPLYFRTLGVKTDPMIPHTWGLEPTGADPQGVVVVIYIRTSGSRGSSSLNASGPITFGYFSADPSSSMSFGRFLAKPPLFAKSDFICEQSLT